MNGIEVKEFNIIMGFNVENRSCRQIKQFFEEKMERHLSEGKTVNAVNLTTDRLVFDDSVRGGMYNVGFVMEVMNDTPIGQGGVKAWRRDNPNIRIILVMEESRRSTGKAKGLFDIGYYDGFFVGESVSTELLVSLLEKGRTKEEAYEYYGLANYVEPEKKSKMSKTSSVEETNIKEIGQLDLNASSEQMMPVIQNKRMRDDVSTGADMGGMLLNMESVGISNKRQSHISQLSLGSNNIEENIVESVPENVTVEEANSFEASTVEIDDEYVETKEEFPSTLELMADEHIYEDENSFGSGAFDFEENRSTLSFSDSMTGEQAEEDGKETAAQSIILANRTYTRKSLNEILESKESISKYFTNRTTEAYANMTGGEKELSPLERMFAECYEQFARQYNVVFEDAVTGAISRDAVSEKLYDVVENQSATIETKIAIMDMFFDYTYGYDILQGLLDANDVTEIHVLSRYSIRVKKGSVRYSTDLAFHGKGRYEGFCEQLLIRNRDKLTSDGTTKTFTDSTYSDKFYLQVSIRSADFTTTNEPEIHIKKTPKGKRTLKSLCSHKKISKENAGYLTYAVLEKRGIIICGAPSSGKTTLLNALMDYIPADKSAIALQHRDELVPGAHPEISVIHPRVKSKDNQGASLVDLAMDVLGGDAEYFIMGDIKGPEAEPCYHALLSSYIVWSCMTCANPEDALEQFAKYVQASGNKSSYDEIMYMLCDKIGTIVYMDDLSVVDVFIVEEYKSESGIILKNVKELFDWQSKAERKES